MRAARVRLGYGVPMTADTKPTHRTCKRAEGLVFKVPLKPRLLKTAATSHSAVCHANNTNAGYARLASLSFPLRDDIAYASLKLPLSLQGSKIKSVASSAAFEVRVAVNESSGATATSSSSARWKSWPKPRIAGYQVEQAVRDGL